MRVDADIAIVGSGFAGSLTALALRQRGKRVVLVERGRHPRFAIGESSTPLANLLLEELADAYDLPRIRVFSKWGTWQRARPDVAGGLKRGFTFYFHHPGEPFADDETHSRQLMVAASPNDDIGDTHWYRPDFDLNLVREAQAAGVVYLDDTSIAHADVSGERVSIDGVRQGASVRIDADFLVDASGPRGLLARQFSLEVPPRWLPRTQGVYTHFENVARFDADLPHPPDLPPPDLPYPADLPYPPDDAALHHILPDGWIWVLRFNNGITSAGAALTRDGSWSDTLARFPSIATQFRDARVVAPWARSPSLAFRTSRTGGRNWALLPSAAGVIDPLLSTGFPLTLLGIHRLVPILADGARGEALREYERITQAELDATEMLVAALYRAMSDPPLFKKLTLLYFAAASFSEAARRLGRPELAPGFLLHAHPVFGPALHTCCAIALASPQGRAREELLKEIDSAIEPFDIAGLRDRSRRDWYPALAEDLIANASKLHATAGDVEALLERCGFERSSSSITSDTGPTRNSA